MQSNNQVEIKEKLYAAANWRGKDEPLLFRDHTYDTFIKVMEARRRVAQTILSSHKKDEIQQCEELFEYYNEQLRKVLGI